MEIKTTKQIREHNNFEWFKQKKWVAVNDDLDLYRELINKYGKVNVWNWNVDKICEKIEERIKNGNNN